MPRISTDLSPLRHTLLAALGLSSCTGSIDKPDGSVSPTDIVPDTDTADTGAPPAGICPEAESLLDRDGNASGYVMCSDGAINRTSSHVWASGSCSTDDDCADGQVCIGDDIAGVGDDRAFCIEADCETSSDCDSAECGLSSYDDGCGPIVRLACRTDEDECRSDDSCSSSADQCVTPYWSEEVWVCAGYDCAIGRPLILDGPQGADGQSRGIVADIRIEPGRVADIPGLDAETRSVLAAWWAHVAQMEHASVASFARVTLELMSLGAPPELLRGVQSAASDEIEHAQIAFEQASRFAGVTMGPAPMDTAGVRPRVGAKAVLHGLITEACVGETVGVAEARAAKAGCTDDALKAVFTSIIDDESRHAALAWRTLAWLLEQHPELVGLAEEAFTQATDAILSGQEIAMPDRPQWGLLGPRQRASLRQEAISTVVLPCAQAVLDRARSHVSAQQ